MVEYQHSTTCRLCGSKKLNKTATNLKDPQESVKDSFDILACSHCGFHFTDPMILNKDLGFLYEGNYFGIDNKLSFFENLYRFDQYRYDFGIYRKYFSKDMTILDYGCGNGSRVEYLRKQGFNATGIDEFDMITTDLDKSLYVIENPINFFPKQKYDVVFMYHVLEHLREFDDQINHIKTNILKKGGFLVIQVPNVDCWQFKKYPQNDNLYEVPRHFWHFNKKSIKFMMENRGLRTINQNCKNSILHPSTILSSVFKFNIRQEWAKPNPNKWIIHAKFGLFCLLSIPILFWENLRDDSPILNCIFENK